MAVEPNSTIRLCTGVPLNMDYENTIYFPSKAKQAEYFFDKTEAVFPNTSYQRVSLGIIRVFCNADMVQNCNYLAFINSNHGAKWFYAFITDIKYINENTCEVNYVLDDLQTYLFDTDVEILPCFVEREHSATDNFGDNIIPEDIEVHEWVNSSTDVGTGLFSDYTIALITNYQRLVDVVGEIATRTYSKLYMGSPITKNGIMLANHYYKEVKPTSDPSSETTALGNAYTAFFLELQDLLSGGYPVSPDDVAAVYVVPTGFVDISNYFPPQRSYTLPEGMVMKEHTVALGRPSTLGSYTPRNKKLLTFQFNRLVCNSYSDKYEYGYEFFETGRPIKFAIYANLMTPISFQACPEYYKGQYFNRLEAPVLDNFPTISFGVSNFQQWLNRNGTRLGVQGLMGIAEGLLGVSGGLGRVVSGREMLTPKTGVLSAYGQRQMTRGYNEAFQGASNGLGGVLNALATTQMMVNTGSDFHGTPSGNLEMATNRKDFYFYQKYPEEHHAKMIDDFFDMFGYKTNAIKVPNINVRKEWTYVKTNNCLIKGGAPASSLDKICTIFNNGIRFWRHAENVGKYHLDNSPDLP